MALGVGGVREGRRGGEGRDQINDSACRHAGFALWSGRSGRQSANYRCHRPLSPYLNSHRGSVHLYTCS